MHTIARHLVAIVASLLVLPAHAQDELPNQPAPDMPLEPMAYIPFVRPCEQEVSDNPAEYLYKGWGHEYVHNHPGVTVPDTFLIDLTNYVMPTDHERVNDIFGYRPRRRRVHYGLDIDVEVGDTIRAAFAGKVRVSRFERRGYGNYLIIRHENGLETVYGHMSRKLVEEDDIVHAGDPIGLGGSTGRSTGPHLHFETRLCGTALNPALMFDFPNQRTTGDSYLYVKPKKGSGTGGEGAATYYRVKQGDTLSKIAARNGTTINTICKLNGISRNSIIRPGQRLRLH